MAFYTNTSERQLMERNDHKLLFRWFVGCAMDNATWDYSTFTNNRDRLFGGARSSADRPRKVADQHGPSVREEQAAASSK
jgi:IS5 family transposase